jgi:methionyl aminopeptidase
MIYIKNAKEIDAIRESCKIVAETLNLVKKEIRTGITTEDLDKLAEDHIRSRGGIPAFKGYRQVGTPPFPGTLCISINDIVVHGIPGSRTVMDGDLVSLDCGVKKNGYYGDAALSVYSGNDENIKKLMEVTEKSLYLGIEQAVEGNRVHDISYAVQKYVESNGFSVVRALCGHGVGKYLHEDPSIPNYGVKGTGKKLKDGMTLAIEPMVDMGKFEVYELSDGWTIKTIDGLPSAHFEHTILVNGQKPEILTVE